MRVNMRVKFIINEDINMTTGFFTRPEGKTYILMSKYKHLTRGVDGIEFELEFDTTIMPSYGYFEKEGMVMTSEKAKEIWLSYKKLGFREHKI
jgi:hypothetical protein